MPDRSRLGRGVNGEHRRPFELRTGAHAVGTGPSRQLAAFAAVVACRALRDRELTVAALQDWFPRR